MKHTEYMRGWRKNNREKYNAIVRKARGKWLSNPENRAKMLSWHKEQNYKRNFGGNRHTVMEINCYECASCGTTKDLTVDHIDGNRQNNAINNLQVLCKKCHGSKDGKRGWIHLPNGMRIRYGKICVKKEK